MWRQESAFHSALLELSKNCIIFRNNLIISWTYMEPCFFKKASTISRKIRALAYFKSQRSWSFVWSSCGTGTWWWRKVTDPWKHWDRKKSQYRCCRPWALCAKMLRMSSIGLRMICAQMPFNHFLTWQFARFSMIMKPDAALMGFTLLSFAWLGSALLLFALRALLHFALQCLLLLCVALVCFALVCFALLCFALLCLLLLLWFA